MNSNRAGFVLPLAAVGVALLALALFAAASALSDRSGEMRRLEWNWRYALGAANLEARLAHLVLTEPRGPRAIDVGAEENAVASPRWALADRSRTSGNLVLDGRRYLFAPPSGFRFAVSVQDEAGLFNLNNNDEASTARLLTQLGVEPREAERLAAVLADFIDGDDLRRVNGAESADYAAAGLPLPRNALLTEPTETRLALDWRTNLAPQQEALFLALTTAGEADLPFNPNTAPAQVLAALLGADQKGVNALLEARDVRTLVSGEDVSVASGADLLDSRVTFSPLPARDLRLTITSAGDAPEASFVYVSRLSVADDRSDRPFYWRRSIVPRGGTWTGGQRDGDDRMDEFPNSPALLAARKR